MRRATIPVLLGFLFLLPRSAASFDVTTPGQVVPKGQVGVVLADLVCAPPAVGVTLEHRATLDLNGHVLDGCTVAAASGSPTKPQRMTVRGPGQISNATFGIYLLAGTLRVADVTITDSTEVAIYGANDPDTKSTVRLTDVVVTGSDRAAVQASRVVVRGMTATGNGTASGDPAILGWGGVTARDVTLTGNGSGVFAAAGQVRINDAQITGNQSIGVSGFRVSIGNSTVTGNTTTGPPTEADVISSYRPFVRNSTCGTSLKADATGSWGVCAGD